MPLKITIQVTQTAVVVIPKITQAQIVAKTIPPQIIQARSQVKFQTIQQKARIILEQIPLLKYQILLH